MKKNMNVLVVDDAKVLRITIKKILESLGHTVIAEADNGSEAIKLYKKYKPDLVTMDISMPEVDGIKNGIDALEKIIEFDKDATVMMMTSHSEKLMVMDAISKGSKGYALKPISKDRIEAMINETE